VTLTSQAQLRRWRPGPDHGRRASLGQGTSLGQSRLAEGDWIGSPLADIRRSATSSWGRKGPSTGQRRPRQRRSHGTPPSTTAARGSPISDPRFLVSVGPSDLDPAGAVDTGDELVAVRLGVPSPRQVWGDIVDDEVARHHERQRVRVGGDQRAPRIDECGQPQDLRCHWIVWRPARHGVIKHERTERTLKTVGGPSDP
jgi:hypothetical protein